MSEPAGLKRRATIRDLAAVTTAVLAIATTVRVVWPRFGYWGDNADSFLPLWHLLGTRMRDGESVLFDPDGWAGGSMVAEAAYGVFNPVTLANAFAISFLDDLSLGAFLVMAEFLVILALGVYALARVIGAPRWSAVAVAVAMPFAGFTLFYGAGNWASGLMSIAWVTHFWWSALAYSRGRVGPWLPFLFGALAATVGNPYAMLGIVVVLIGLAVEIALRRDWRRLGGAITLGASVGLVLVLVYLPLMMTMAQTDRADLEAFANGNYLSPSVGDMVAMSSPAYLTRTLAWTSSGDLVPSSYLAWFVIPLLPWVRRGAVRLSAHVSVLVTTGVFVLLSLGPDSFWLFRWPIRFLEYTYVGLIALVAVAIGHGLATDHVRRRAALSAALVGFGAYSAWSSDPAPVLRHSALAVLVAVLVTLAVVALVRLPVPRRRLAAAAVLIGGTAMVTGAHAHVFAWDVVRVTQTADLSAPVSLETVREASAGATPPVLQVADIYELDDEAAVSSGEIVFGNTRAATGVETINRYTGIAFRQLTQDLSIDYRGSVFEQLSLTELFAPVRRHTVSPLDAMGVNSIIVDARREDIATLAALPAGWHEVVRSTHRVILARDEPLPAVVLTPSPGLDAELVAADGSGLTFTIDADEPGTVLVDRLAWQGYRAAAGDVDLTVSEGPLGLLRIDVPAGRHTVEVAFDVPGLRVGVGAATLGLLMTVVHTLVHRRRRPRAAAATDEP